MDKFLNISLTDRLSNKLIYKDIKDLILYLQASLYWNWNTNVWKL